MMMMMMPKRWERLIIIKIRYVDMRAKGFNVCLSFSVLSFKSLNALYVSKRCVN